MGRAFLFFASGFSCPIGVIETLEGWGVVFTGFKVGELWKFRSFGKPSGDGRIINGAPSILFGYFAGPGALFEFVRIVGMAGKRSGADAKGIRPVGTGYLDDNVMRMTPNCVRYGRVDPVEMASLAEKAFFEVETKPGAFSGEAVRAVSRSVVVSEDPGSDDVYDPMFSTQIAWLRKAIGAPLEGFEDLVRPPYGGSKLIKLTRAAPVLAGLLSGQPERTPSRVARLAVRVAPPSGSQPANQPQGKRVAAVQGKQPAQPNSPVEVSGIGPSVARKQSLNASEARARSESGGISDAKPKSGIARRRKIKAFGIESPDNCRLEDPRFSASIVARVNLAGVVVHARETGDVCILPATDDPLNVRCVSRVYNTLVTIDPDVIEESGLSEFWRKNG
jgi:hypothetical protein